MSKQNW